MMLQKKKLLIPKQILASKNVMLTKHNDGIAQEIFNKYSVLRNELAAWFELVYKVDITYEDYNTTDIGQLLINVRMQLQLQEEGNKSSLSILGQQALINFKKQLESTVKTVYSSAGHQSLKYLNERLLQTDITNSILFEKAYNREIYKDRSPFSYIYGNYTNIQKAINTFNHNSNKPYNAAWGALKNAISFKINSIKSNFGFGSILNQLTQFYINGGRKAKNSFNFQSIKPEYAAWGAFKNALTLNFNTIAGRPNLENYLNHLNQLYINWDRKAKNSLDFKGIKPHYTGNRALLSALSFSLNTIAVSPDIENVLSLLNKFYINGEKPDLENVFVNPVIEINGFIKGNNSFYLQNIKDNISTIYTRVNTIELNRLYSNLGSYGYNYKSIVHLNPYNLRNYYRLYFLGLSSYIGAGFKMAYVQGGSIKEFSSIIHDKIVDGLRNNLLKELRSNYHLSLLGVNRTRQKHKKEMDSETKEFWHNMTYNIIQGFRKELESKTSYFFTNHIDKRAYGLLPFLEDEGEDEESTNGNWVSQETLIHNKHTSFAHFREQEKGRITPQSINNLRKTYPDIYNMLSFAGLLPTLYVQKHSRETAMGILSKSIHQYYIENRNLSVRAYDLLRNKLETEEKGFIWPEAINNLPTMEFGSSRKAHRSSSHMAEIQALKTQVVNIEKQTLQSVQSSNVNINGLVERVYREIEQRIKVDRVRRGY